MHRVEVQLEDDLTGGPADETVQFGMDGRTYEIDLTARHAAEFRRRLEPFIERARSARARRPAGTVRTAASRERSRQIRAWAMQHGLELSPHGRLPRDVVMQYEAAHASGQSSTTRRSAATSTAARRKPAETPARTSRPRSAPKSSSSRTTTTRRRARAHLEAGRAPRGTFLFAAA